jgi:putative membrane protein
MRFLARLLLNGVAVLVAAYFIPGLRLESETSALVAGVALGLVNAVIRPVLVLLTLPLTLLTLGLFIFVINGICLGIAAAVVPGFQVDGFWAAFFGALVVTVVSWILNGLLIGDRADRRPARGV